MKHKIILKYSPDKHEFHWMTIVKKYTGIIEVEMTKLSGNKFWEVVDHDVVREWMAAAKTGGLTISDEEFRFATPLDIVKKRLT